MTVGGSATTRRRPRRARGARRRTSRRAAPTSASCAGALRGVRLSRRVRRAQPAASAPDGAARTLRAAEGRRSPEQVEELEQRLRAWARARAPRPPGATRPPSRWPAPAAGSPAGCGRSPARSCGPGAALVLDARRLRRARCATRSRSSPARAGSTSRRSAARLVFEVATRARQGGVPCYAVVGQRRPRRVRAPPDEHRGRGRARATERPASATDVERAARRAGAPALASG